MHPLIPTNRCTASVEGSLSEKWLAVTTTSAGMNGSILNALGLTNSQKGSGSVLIAEVRESLSGVWPIVMGSSGVRDTLLEVISCVPPLVIEDAEE
mmetsp:Transcript_44870/g.61314  ORF Transcript_44870/g.61314 Transcript_44870/m.61314 type:complete len:96 (-) Transcript_44870:114-401(-)